MNRKDTHTQALRRRVLSALRKRKWSVKHLAEVADLPYTTVTNFVSGQNTCPRYDTAMQMLAAIDDDGS
jgi:predicted transcriptional regulator